MGENSQQKTYRDRDTIGEFAEQKTYFKFIFRDR